LKAKKHLGQHFLTDKSVINDILMAIQKACPSDMPLVEVGPGQGVLTYPLAESYEEFKAIEFDRDMIAVLSEQLPPHKLLQDNFLSVDFSTLFRGEGFNLVGNFPYNISSQIVFKMLDNRSMIPTMVGMFQKEVAERICAAPGTKANGIITLRTQAYYHAEKLFDIGPSAFNPPPKVNSSVIKLTRKENAALPVDESIYNNIIKISFQQRRKKLRNTLKSYLQDLDDPILQMRPEQLGVQDFINIVALIEKQKK